MVLSLYLVGSLMVLGPSSAYGQSPQRAPAAQRSLEATRSANPNLAAYQAYMQKYLNQPGRIQRDHSVVSLSGAEYFHRAPASVSSAPTEESSGKP